MLLKLILFYPWYSYSFLQMDAPASPRPSDTFLHEFGTPTLLWRVLRTVGYTEPPQYSWWEMESTGGIQWFAVQGVVPPHGDKPAWTGWTCSSDGQTPWEAAQVAAQTILLDICQRCGDELTGGPAASIPSADPAAAEWKQADGCALVRGRGERAESSSPAMSAMMAVLKLISQREGTYAQVMVAVRRAQEMQRKAEKRARKFRKQARLLPQAQKDRNDWEHISEYRRQQWVKAIRERDHKQDQISQLARERETIQERLVQITRERDTALRVSENRRRAWEMHQI